MLLITFYTVLNFRCHKYACGVADLHTRRNAASNGLFSCRSDQDGAAHDLSSPWILIILYKYNYVGRSLQSEYRCVSLETLDYGDQMFSSPQHHLAKQQYLGPISPNQYYAFCI